MEEGGQIQASAALYPEERAPSTLCRRLVGPLSQCKRCGEEKNHLFLLSIEPQYPDHPALNLVTIPAELSRLLRDQTSSTFPGFLQENRKI
jgi:hypothetical protein